MRRADRDYLAQRGFRLSAPDGRVLFEGLRSRLLVGSAPGCDVRIDDPTVSRHHCELTAGDTAYSVRDLDSTNGTRLDGTEVYRAPLPPGAELALGEVRLRFEPLADLVPVTEADRFGELIGSSAEMRRLFGLMERLAATELTCVLCGETGTGKELAARALHDASSRADAPFVVVDCGAVSASLVESELFGHERGAYTGADAARAGAFEDASGGTVFLDEIGELPLELQPKLLRVLERREVKRLGATRHLTVDVRVVAATHRALDEMVEAAAFREDLYFRLAEAVVHLPPLRDRPTDLPLLAAALARRARPGIEVTRGAVEALRARPFPGNVRELRNLIRRALALSEGSASLTEHDLAAAERLGPRRVARPEEAISTRTYAERPLKEARALSSKEWERAYVSELLARFQGDTHAAAEHAQVHRKTLLRLIKEHGLEGAA